MAKAPDPSLRRSSAWNFEPAILLKNNPKNRMYYVLHLGLGKKAEGDSGNASPGEGGG